MAPELAAPANTTATSVTAVRTSATSSFLRKHPNGATTLPRRRSGMQHALLRFWHSHDNSGCRITNGVTDIRIGGEQWRSSASGKVLDNQGALAYPSDQGMSKGSPSLPYGTLDLLVLRTLAGGARHGYGILLQIHEASSNLLRIEEGSLYPALHRLETSGLLKAEWMMSENNRRAKYYRLTGQGRRQLAEEERNWERVAEGVSRVLRFG